MRPFGTRADAELLAQALDAPVPALPARLAAEARVVARLAALRSALAPATAVRPDFRTALRARLVAEAARAVPAAAAQAPPRAAAATAPAGTAERDRLRERVRRIAELPASTAPRRVAVLTGATAVLVLVGGIGLAADRSYPGEPFYDVKRGRQAVELRLARGSDVERGLRHLQLASERLREMQVVARRAAADSAGPTGTGAAGSGNVFGDVLAEHDDRVRAGGELVLQGSQETRSAQPLLVLQTWSDAQSAGLTGLAPDLPESARQRVQTSLQVLAGLRAQATGRLPSEPCRSGCASPPPATAPGASSPPPVGTGGTALGRSALA